MTTRAAALSIATPAQRSAGHKRSASKPNSSRRQDIRASLPLICAVCMYESDWSAAQGVEGSRLEIAHIVGENIGGTYAAENIVGMCETCNRDAYNAGHYDLTSDIHPEYPRTAKWLPAALAKTRGDVRTFTPLAGLANKRDRRTSRQYLGIVW